MQAIRSIQHPTWKCALLHLTVTQQTFVSRLRAVTMVLDVGNRDRVGKTPALKVHRVLFDEVLVTAGNQTSVYLDGTAWSPGQTELLDVRLQIWSLRFFEDCPQASCFTVVITQRYCCLAPLKDDWKRIPAEPLLLRSIFGQLFSKAIKRFNFLSFNICTCSMERGF